MALFRPNNRMLFATKFPFSCSVSYRNNNPPEPSISFPNQKRNCSCDSNAVCKGKIAIVTGGSRGIGYHITDYLLKGGCECVIIGSRNVDNCEKTTIEMNKKYGEQKCLFQPLDVTKKEELDKIFKCTHDRFGKIDIVVNNSGLLRESKWEETININCFGVVYGTLLGFKHMSIQNGGCGGIIVNMASIVGLQPLPYSPTYSATKHFVVGFTRCIGHDYFYKQAKVKVVAVLPGVTDTDMVRLAQDEGLPQFPGMGKELVRVLGSLPPQGPEEVAKGMLTSGLLVVDEVENGSIWVSEACEFYKVNIPTRESYKPKPEDRAKKPPPPKEEKKESKKLQPCVLELIKTIEKEQKELKDKCEKKDPHKANSSKSCASHKEDTCKPKKEHKKKDDPCASHKEDPCKPKKEHKQKDDPCASHKEDPCKPKKEHKQKDDSCGSHKEDPCKPKKERKKKEDECGSQKEDPCKPKKEQKKKDDLCGSHKENHCKPVKQPKKKKGDPGGSHKEDQCKPKKEPKKQQGDPCGSPKEDSCKPKKDPKKKDDACGSQKEDPCRPKKQKDEPSHSKHHQKNEVCKKDETKKQEDKKQADKTPKDSCSSKK